MASNIPPEYLSGQRLWGDDFTPEQIAAWYEDETEAYAALGRGSAVKDTYLYAALDRLHAWRRLPGSRRFDQVLGIGSARGEEFAQIAERIDHLTILEPSTQFVSASIHGVPTRYVKPAVDGAMPFANGFFDLTVCLGTLHHIPNVSFVIGELYRTLKPGGYAVVREPIVSLGDWTRPRRGLTARERGIPLDYLRTRLVSDGFEIVRQSPCFFSPVRRLLKLVGVRAYSSPLGSQLDAMGSRMFLWNRHYHPANVLEKLAPAAVYFVLRRPGAQSGSSIRRA